VQAQRANRDALPLPSGQVTDTPVGKGRKVARGRAIPLPALPPVRAVCLRWSGRS